MALYITTTGTLSPIPLPDLGRVPGLVHPLTDYDITNEFDLSELVDSLDFQAAINNGHLTASSSIGGSSITPEALTSPIPIHGSWRQREVSNNQESTGSSKRTKITLTTPDLPAGTYEIKWRYMWAVSDDKFFLAELVHNGSQIYYHAQTPEEKGNDQQIPACWFEELTLSGINTFELKFWAEKKTAYMSNALMILQRVE